MKLKLAALLFSQAATATNKIDVPPYACNKDGLFTEKAETVTPIVYAPHVTQMQTDVLNSDYSYYCQSKGFYNAAVSEDEKHIKEYTAPCTFFEGDSRQAMIGSDCLKKTGKEFLYACENIKQRKKDMPETWNKISSDFNDCEPKTQQPTPTTSYSSQGVQVFNRP